MNRDPEHRIAMKRNLAASLFEHETVSTTIEKAKEVKPFAEKLITLAKKGTLAARRRAISLLGNRSMVGEEEGGPVEKGTVIQKLFSEIGPRYLDRPGGYTRIIRLSKNRLGDNGNLVLLQLVGEEVQPKQKKTAHQKAAPQTDEIAEEAAVEQSKEVVEVNEEGTPVAETKSQQAEAQEVQPDDQKASETAGQPDEPAQEKPKEESQPQDDETKTQ